MGQHTKRILAVAVLLASMGYSMVTPSLASAANNSGSVLTTSPVAINLTGKPGESVSTTLQVQNNSPVAKTIDVLLDTFRAKGDSGQAVLSKPSPNDNYTSWVHFSKTSFVAQPGVWNSVTMTITLPEDAALGYYYAVLFEPHATAGTLPKDTSAVKGANAIFVLLDAKTNGEKRQLHLTSFSSSKRVYEYLPADFSVTLQNLGNIHLVPSGDIFISRTKLGKTIATLEINPGQGNVLPQTSRQFKAQWTDGLPVFEPKRINSQIMSDKQGQPIQQLHWDTNSSISKIRFGKYYAHLALVYNNGTTNVTTDSYVSFWVIPWKLILLFIASLASIITIWVMFKKSVKKLWHKLHKPGQASK